MHWSDVVRSWGTTAEEQQRCFPCDRVLPDHNEAYYRAVTVLAEPAILFRWLCQMRVAPYSYDWLDNFGRRSPPQLTPDLETLELGQPFMTIFDLVDFEQHVHITLRLRRPGLFPPLAVSYFLDAGGEPGCRLIVKLVLQFRPGLRDRMLRRLAPWLDWVMMRRQLLNLKALAEGVARHSDEADRP
jgi:hypothetical protein